MPINGDNKSMTPINQRAAQIVKSILSSFFNLLPELLHQFYSNNSTFEK